MIQLPTCGDHHGCDRMVVLVGFITTQESVPITTNVVGLNHAHSKVYSIQH